MKSSFAELTRQIAEASDDTRRKVVADIISRIRQWPASARGSLVREAMANRTTDLPGKEWDPRRTLVGVILHAARVPEIESDEQRELRKQIESELTNLNGNPEAYRGWIAAEDALKLHGIRDDESTRE